MKKDVLERIKQDFATYSKGQKLIASFILENYDKAAYMTAAKMGALVGVSESTVVRFATQLGYAGYPEFQRSLQEVIRSKLTSVQRIQVTNSRQGFSVHGIFQARILERVAVSSSRGSSQPRD